MTRGWDSLGTTRVRNLRVGKVLHTSIDRIGLGGKEKLMEEPGLDNRHRDKNPPKAGEIEQKHGNTLNKHLPVPIPEFSPETTVQEMRDRTGEVSIEKIREAAKKLR